VLALGPGKEAEEESLSYLFLRKKRSGALF
jgi:hypothetical protein